MKIKVSELSGIALDWAVAKCEDKGSLWSREPEFVAMRLSQGIKPSKYSSDWSQGGPIIERERINSYQLSQELWESSPSFGMSDEFIQYGPTPLIAAMRCYVASKMGEEVEVPNELSKKEYK